MPPLSCTAFSDQKSGEVHVHKSHLREPMRLGRLLIAFCLAYLWIVYLSVCAMQADWMHQIHRQDRCDLSLLAWDCACWPDASTSRYQVDFWFQARYRGCSSVYFRNRRVSTYFLYGSQDRIMVAGTRESIYSIKRSGSLKSSK